MICRHWFQKDPLVFHPFIELRNTGISQSVLEKLADADAFNSIGLDRRRALWEISTGNDQPIGLFAGQQADQTGEEKVNLPVMRTSEHVVLDYASTSLSFKSTSGLFCERKTGKTPYFTYCFFKFLLR